MSPQPHEPPTRLLTIPQTQEFLGCSENHVYRLIATGQLRAVDIKPKSSKRTKTRIREDDLQAFINAHTRRANEPTLRSVAGEGGDRRSEVRRIDGT